jgi:hypothetical protein
MQYVPQQKQSFLNKAYINCQLYTASKNEVSPSPPPLPHPPPIVLITNGIKLKL